MRLSACSTSFGALWGVLRGALRCGLCCALLLADPAGAALPPTIARAFHDQRIPLTAVSAYVQEIGAANSVKPLLMHRASQPMNPASTMKLVTTFAGLELLGPDYRWKTEAYADGPIVAGVLTGDLVRDGGDWHSGRIAEFNNRAESADATFRGRYPIACGERDWYVALLDHPHYVLSLFARTWADVGGSFAGTVRDGRTPLSATHLATLDSVPLYEAVRDINKMSNNLMARQLFLSLATTAYPPPATTRHAAEAVERWLAKRKLKFPELVMVNGSGLSRHERIAAQSMARLLLAADSSSVRNEYISSLAVAATDGTVIKRFQNDEVADQAFLKTGTLEGVRAIAGYVFGPTGRRFVVVCFVNHPNASRAQPPLDHLVQWVYDNAR